jgi:hypothetical protein
MFLLVLKTRRTKRGTWRKWGRRRKQLVEVVEVVTVCVNVHCVPSQPRGGSVSCTDGSKLGTGQRARTARRLGESRRVRD